MILSIKKEKKKMLMKDKGGKSFNGKESKKMLVNINNHIFTRAM